MRRANWLFMLVWATAVQAESPPLAGSPLSSFGLATMNDTRVVRLQNVAGDSRVDLLTVRPRGLGRPPLLDFHERRDRIPRQTFGLAPPGADTNPRPGYGVPQPLDVGGPVLDVQGLFIPGGVIGAGRDLVVLLGGETPVLRSLRNRDPDTSPRFSPLGSLAIPGATRLHYPVQVPVPPGAPGFVNLPLAVSTADGGVAVVRFDGSGSASVVLGALPHPGGARDVLYLLNLPGIPVALLTLGAGEPWLWTPVGEGWSGSPIALPGKPAAVATHGLLGEFDGATGLDLVVAFDNGTVWRWNAETPTVDSPPVRWGAAAAVTSGLRTTELVEMLTGPIGASVSALVVAGSPESRVFLATPGTPGQPFGPVAQRLPAARTAFGDFGIGLLVLASDPGGLTVYERAEAVNDETPFSVEFDTDEPIPVAGQTGGGGVFEVTVRSNKTAAMRYGVGIAHQTVPDGEWLGSGARRLADMTPSDFFPQIVGIFAEGLSRETYAAVFNMTPPTRINAIRLYEVIPDNIPNEFDVVPAPVRDPPPERAAFLLPPECLPDRTEPSARICLAECYNRIPVPASLAAPPSPGTKASSSLFTSDDLALLRRFRDGVLAASPKGRDYDAMYYELSPAIYRAVLRRPSRLLEFVAARDAWLPAIRSLVDGDGSHPIDAAMLDRLDALAEFMVLDTDPALSATLADEYRRLDPRSLEGQTMDALHARFVALPTREVFGSGFEAGGASAVANTR